MRIGIALLLLTRVASAQLSSTEARQQDLNFISNQLPKLHPDFFFQLSPADFAMAVSSLQSQIPTLTDAQFYVGLARLVAMAGDGHTTLYLDNPAAANAGFQTFPMTFTWLDDGIFVTAAAADVSVRAGGVELASGSVTVTATGPGLFVLQSTDPSQPGAIENQDSTVNSQSNPAPAGSVLQIFATGYGPLDSTGAAPVTVLLGGTSAEVLYSGPVGQYPGLWQINARVPNTFTGQLPIQVIAGNAASNAVTLWVH